YAYRRMSLREGCANPRVRGFRSSNAPSPFFNTSYNKSDTPRRAGGLMSGAPSNGVGSLVKASRRARLVQHSELPCCSIRFLFLADVAANFVRVQTRPWKRRTLEPTSARR